MKAVILLYMLLIVSFTSYATQVNSDGTIKEVPMSTTATSYELTASPPSSEWTFTKGFSLSANGNGWYKVPPEETSYSAKYERRDNVTTYWVDSATVFGTVISGTMYKKTGGNGGAGGGAPVYWGLKAVGNQAKNPTIYPLGPLSLPVGIATEFKYLFNGVEAPGGTWKYSGNTAATPSANVSTNYGNVTGSRFSFPASGIVPGVYHLSAARNTAGDQEASSDAITVVGVKQVSATYGTTTITSTTNTPGNNETLYVPKGTSSITITATPEPESSWPNEYPTFKVNSDAISSTSNSNDVKTVVANSSVTIDGKVFDLTWNSTNDAVTFTQDKTAPATEDYTGSFTVTAKCGSSEKSINVYITSIDLRIDSNNDGTIDDEDEKIEEDSGKPGKIIPINNLDKDADGIPDFADGFDCANAGHLPPEKVMISRK